jgi:hypothetical protein
MIKIVQGLISIVINISIEHIQEEFQLGLFGSSKKRNLFGHRVNIV